MPASCPPSIAKGKPMKARFWTCLCLTALLIGSTACSHRPVVRIAEQAEAELTVDPGLLADVPAELEPPLRRGDPVRDLEAAAENAATAYRDLAARYNALACVVRDFLDGPETVDKCERPTLMPAPAG